MHISQEKSLLRALLDVSANKCFENASTKTSPSIRGEHHIDLWSGSSSCPCHRSSHLSKHGSETPWDSPAEDHSRLGRLNIQRTSSGKQTFASGSSAHAGAVETCLQHHRKGRASDPSLINWDMVGSILMLVTYDPHHAFLRWLWLPI